MDTATTQTPATASTPHGRIVESRFRAHPLFRHAHSQTILPTLLRPLPSLAIRRERLELDDGDFIDLGWSGEHNAGGPIAILVHGLTGGFQSKYLRGLARRLIAQGWRSCIVQLRGAGPEPNRTSHLYNHGDTADLRRVWHLLRAREPRAMLVSVGWSLGGNVSLKALAEEGDAAPVDFAAAASVPFRLQECVERLRAGPGRIYQDRLLRDIREAVARKHRLVPTPAGVDLERALLARDFYQFDNAYTAPLHGYRDAEDYYDRAACGQYLHGIRRETLIVHALDDPFMVPDIVPQASTLAPQVTLELSQNGGHVGFIAAGERGRPLLWLEQRLEEYLLAGVAARSPALAA